MGVKVKLTEKETATIIKSCIKTEKKLGWKPIKKSK